MPDSLDKQDLWDWIMAYREICLLQRHAEHWSLELYALTRLGELAGLFGVDPALLQSAAACRAIDRMFVDGSGNPGLSTYQLTTLDRRRGQRLAIQGRYYLRGENYDRFVGEMRRYVDLLPLSPAGTMVTASMLDGISQKLAPEVVLKTAREIATQGSQGAMLLLAQKELAYVTQKVLKAVMAVVTDKDDPYLDDLALLLKLPMAYHGFSRDEQAPPAFGL